MAQVTVLTGCAGTGKTTRLLEDYRAALDRAKKERRPGTVLWLVPNRRAQKTITRQILAQFAGICFSPHVLTFDLFANKILDAAGSPASPISPVMKRVLLRRIADSMLQQGLLQHFQSIAATTGFLDVVSSFISELKREEIWPNRFTEVCKERSSASARRDHELGLIYERYQQHLNEQNWYDNEGRFWLARNELNSGRRDPFADVRFLAVDGFADFTQTQYEIIGHLAGWIEQIEIALCVEHPINRNDLFSKPHAAIARIREQLPPGVKLRPTPLQTLDSTDSASTSRGGWSRSIGVIADHLFSNPRFCPISKDVQGIEIIKATGQLGEWEAVARRIKKLMSGGRNAVTDLDDDLSPLAAKPMRSGAMISSGPVRPQEIVIGLRSLADDGLRLRDYLEAAGLPVWCESDVPLVSSSIVKAVLQLLELETNDWQFDRLHSVLDSNFFQPDWPELAAGRAARSVAAALRRLRLRSGRETMLRVLGRIVTEASNAEVTSSLTTAARQALPLLVKLSRTLDRLRRAHTLADWADTLAAVADDLGWLKPGSTPSGAKNSELVAKETAEWDLFQRILRTAAEADQKLAGENPPPSLTLDQFATELLDLLSHESLKSPAEPEGCIRILDVEQIRNLDVTHLFLIGLTENSFPRNRTDDCLFSESERQDFIARGLPLSHRSRQHTDEMFLFYSVVTRARRGLTLSYPVVNAKGHPLYPSPYVTALTSLFDQLTISTEGQLDPVPTEDRALTQTDLRLLGIDEARRGKPGLFRALLEMDPLRRACFGTLSACRVADQRFHQRGFTDYEGQLGVSQNLTRLGQKFGSQHQFSATELEAYARCPFQFWMSSVLNLQPLESPEQGTDFALRGTLLHDVLSQLLAEGSLDDSDALPVRFRELVDERLGRQISNTELQRALIDIERSVLSEWAAAFAMQEAEYSAKMSDLLKRTRSLPPEIPFGRLPGLTDSESSVPPIQFGRGNSTVNLRGRIDRVDVGTVEGHPAYVVVDYKTGQRPSSRMEDLVSGRSIQLALYLIAIKRLGIAGPDAIPYQMGYWALREKGFKQGHGSTFKQIDATDVQWLEGVLDSLLPRLADEIRAGRFVVENEDPDCTGRCAYRTVCRVNQLRPVAERLSKQSSPRNQPEQVDVSESPAIKGP